MVKQNAEWYESGLSFECTQCGACCSGPPGFVWFNEEEAEKIASFLKLDSQQFHRRFARRKFGRWTLDEIKQPNGQYDCVFLRRDTEGKAFCGIYPVRPAQCRTWPFWPENLASPEAWAEAATGCPGMKHGKNFYPIEKIRIIRDSNPKDF